jgi:hypothetical protein
MLAVTALGHNIGKEIEDGTNARGSNEVAMSDEP